MNNKIHPDNTGEQTNGKLTKEHKITHALKSILRELKLSHIHQWGAKSDPDYLNDIDPSTIKSFKDTFTYGRGWNWGSREEFIDMFGCGNTYNFKFTQYECDLLYNEFEVIMQSYGN